MVINLISVNNTSIMSLAGIGTVGTALGVPNYTVRQYTRGEFPDYSIHPGSRA